MALPQTIAPKPITGGFTATATDSQITETIGVKRVKATATLQGGTGGEVTKEISFTVSPKIPQISTQNAPLLDGTASPIWSDPGFSSYTFPVTNVIQPTKDSTLQVTLKLCYDSDNIYGLVNVVNDTWMGAVTAAGDVPASSDSVEIFIRGTGTTSNQFRALLNPLAEGVDTPVTHRPTSTATTTTFKRAVRFVSSTVRELEFAISKSLLAISAPFAINQTIYMDVHYNDSDNSGVRESKVAWLSIDDDLSASSSTNYPAVVLGGLIGGTGPIPGVPTDVTYSKAPANNTGREWGSLPSAGGGWYTHIISDPYSPGTFYTGADVGGFCWWDATTSKWVDRAPLFEFINGDKAGCESVCIAKPTTVGNPGIIYLMGGENTGDATRSGYILRSIDKGESWKALGLRVQMCSNGTGRSRGEMIAVNPEDWQNIIVGTRDGEVYVTTNGGVNLADWTLINSTTTAATSGLPIAPNLDVSSSNQPIITGIAFDPNFPNRVYIALNDGVTNGFTTAQSGIYVSEDSGDTWTKIGSSTNDAGLAQTRRLKVAYNGSSTTRGTLWCTHSNGVSKYVPSGATTGTWTTYNSASFNTISSLNSNNEFRALGLRRDAPNEVLVAQTYTGSPNSKIFRTTNGGTNWSNVAYTINTDVPFQTAISDTHHADQISDFAYDQYNYTAGNANYKTVWFSNYYGTFRCADISVASPVFDTKCLGLSNLVILDVCCPTGSTPYAEVVYGAADATGYAHNTAFNAYPSKCIETDFANGVGGLSLSDRPSHLRSLDYCKSSPANLVGVGISGVNSGTTYTVDAIKSSNGGENWTKLNLDSTLFSTGSAGSNVPGSVAVSSSDPNVIVITRTSGNPALTIDGGANWVTTTGAALDTAERTFWIQKNLCADRVTANKFYYRVNNTLYSGTVSSGNIAWTSVNTALGLIDHNSGDTGRLDDNNTVFGLFAAPSTANDIWIYQYKFFNFNNVFGILRHSIDGGATFNTVTGLSRVVLAAIGASDPSVPTSPYTVYAYGAITVGTVLKWGIYQSTNAYNNNSPTWLEVPFYSYAAINKPQCMAASNKTFGSVFVGTNGSGVFYNTKPSVLNGLSISVTEPLSSNAVYYTGTTTIKALPTKPGGSTAIFQKVEFYSDSIKLGEDTTADGEGKFSIVADLLPGYHQLKAVLTTQLGIVQSQVVTIFVRPIVKYEATNIRIGDPPDTVWNNIKPCEISNSILGSITTALDTSGYWKARYDDNNLYFYLRVYDATLRRDAGTGVNPDDDIIDVFISPSLNTGSTYITSDKGYRIDVVSANTDPSVIYSYNGTTTGAKISNHEVKRFDTLTNTGLYGGDYVLLVKIPLNSLGITPSTSSTQDIGFEIQITDDDDGGARDRKLAWYATDDTAYNNPSKWGIIRLAPRPAIATPETVVINSPLTGFNLHRDSSVDIVTTPSTVSKTLSKVELFVNGVYYSEKAASAVGAVGSFTLEYTPTTVGSKSLVVKASYTDGSVVNSAATVLTVKEPNTITLSSPFQNQEIVLGSSIDIIATANTTIGSVSEVYFFSVLEDNDTPNFFDPPQTATDSLGRYVQPWTPTIAGNYFVRAQAVYNTGESEYTNNVRVTVVQTSTGGGGGGSNTPIAGQFTVSGSKIIGPNGSQFIAKGIRIPGLNNPATRSILLDKEFIEKNWGFNAVVLDCSLGSVPGANDDINSIIDAFTAAKIVVIVSLTDLPGAYITEATTPNLSDVSDFFSILASTYLANPYVWFNPFSQPGGLGTVSSQWVDSHRAAILAIREIAGSNNVIVCSGSAFGQDLGAVGLTTPVEANSAIITYADSLKAFNGKTFRNIAFGVHIQDQWTTNTQPKLTGFLASVNNSNEAIIALSLLANSGTQDLSAMVDPALAALKAKLAGRITGYWYAEKLNYLTDLSVTNTDGAGYRINRRFGTPSNLTAFGDDVWKDVKAINPTAPIDNPDGETTGSVELCLTNWDIVEDIFSLNQEVHVELEIANLGTASSALQTLSYTIFANGTAVDTAQTVGSIPPGERVIITSRGFRMTRPIRSLRIERQS